MKILYVLLFAGMLTGCKDSSSCNDRQSCLNDQKCKCWCSQECGYRDKKTTDMPVYMENDSNGKYCYCNQWDYDHYNGNCIRGEKVPEPGQ